MIFNYSIVSLGYYLNYIYFGRNFFLQALEKFVHIIMFNFFSSFKTY